MQWTRWERLSTACLVLAALAAVSVFALHELTMHAWLPSPWNTLASWSAIGFLLLMVAVVAVQFHGRLRSIQKAHSAMQVRHAIDHVSGAFTRAHFLRLTSEVLSRTEKKGASALIIIDIDHFKQINDVFGHGGGDAVLAFCARTAESTFDGAIIGRLGGDELAVLIEDEASIDKDRLGQACTRFLAVLQDGVWINNCRQSVSASLGIALAPEHSAETRDLLTFADVALSNVKSDGRGAWGVFSPEILADLRQERFIERELRAALLLKELTVHYQPIVDQNGQLNSVEALVRWQSQTRGFISPAEFIPVAEKTQLIHDLGRYVLGCVCADLADLPAVPVNVNVSARQLTRESFLGDYLAVLAKHGVTPDRIILEITESAMLTTSEDFIDRLLAIKAAGFRIALDDFGMGYSEFNQLRQLPFDIIKIDKSYIQNIGTDVVTDTFVSAVTQIAGQMQRVVIAEGIETRDDNMRASVAGCRLFQGYFYQKPVALDVLVGHYTKAKSVDPVAAPSAA